ncbi:MAG: TerB family tellurite resistance protein [Gammaproteobacteria bacterium]|jgi:uncharacterized tellurite resistance protein B-like protein|nr:TerB family tellurite resistance protein [Gammaproteobacteria bacterium]
MLKHWRELFGTVQSAVSGSTETENHRLQLATAVLLIEIMQSDAGASEIEVATVERSLRERFDLSADELASLMSLARARQEAAHDLHAFTSQLHAAFDASEKQRILEMFWQVAYADGKLDDHEHHLMRKLGDLLHVGHAAFISTKLRAAATQKSRE